MRFNNYLKPGQKILMRCLAPGPQGNRLEALTVYLFEIHPESLDLALPYRANAEESYPFAPGMAFELQTEALGLGVRMTGRFHSQQTPELIRVQLDDSLEVFQRRQFPRVNMTVGLLYTKGQGTLRSFRSQWERNLQILSGPTLPEKLSAFPSVPVNISASGIRFAIRPPVAIADLCLLLLDVDQKPPPICTLAEVVWLAEQEEDGRLVTGMRFVAILEADQKRIERVVRELTRQAKNGGG